MNNTNFLTYRWILIVFMLLSIQSHAEFTDAEKKAIADWETVQKSYPQTTRFEKVDEHTYLFKNTGIGYDGKLKLDNVVIDKASALETNSAEFMVKLEVKANTFYEQENGSYSRWTQTNHLLFNKSTDKWVSYQDYDYGGIKSSNCSAKAQKKKKVWNKIITTSVPLILTVCLFWFFLWLFTRGKHNDALRSQKDGIRSNDELTQEIKKLIKVLQEKNNQ